jgi:hypothetical protein
MINHILDYAGIFFLSNYSGFIFFYQFKKKIAKINWSVLFILSVMWICSKTAAQTKKKQMKNICLQYDANGKCDFSFKLFCFFKCKISLKFQHMTVTVNGDYSLNALPPILITLIEVNWKKKITQINLQMTFLSCFWVHVWIFFFGSLYFLVNQLNHTKLKAFEFKEYELLFDI